MLQPMNRPNFFPGQLVDYKDFNRLSHQADHTVSLLCQYLFKGGGVIVDALEGFRVEPVDGLTVRIRSGIALLPNGQAVCLTDDKILDLASFRDEDSDQPLVVAVTQIVRGADRFVDNTDPSIAGYRTELILCDFVFAAGRVPEQAIELFRVSLRPGSNRLRLAGASEGWQEGELGARGEEAIIDLRFRTTIVPQTYVPLSTPEFIQLRRALYSIEDSHRKMGKLYLVPDPFHAVEYLAQVHAEILSRPFQPLKVSYLVSEMAERLSLYLELLSKKLGAAGNKFDDKSLYETIRLLAPFRVRELIPQLRSLENLVAAAKHLEVFVAYASENYQLIGVLEEALADLRNQPQAMDTRLLLAGHPFTRVDLIGIDTADKWNLKASESHTRTMTAQFQNGERMSQKGVFFKQGTVSMDLQLAHADRLACVILPEYIRRAGSIVHYEVNGNDLGSTVTENVEESNRWVNRGLVIPQNFLVQGRNTLRIIVEQADLDFGFCGAAVYQPEFAETIR